MAHNVACKSACTWWCVRAERVRVRVRVRVCALACVRGRCVQRMLAEDEDFGTDPTAMVRFLDELEPSQI